jgi:hypothetical protein
VFISLRPSRRREPIYSVHKAATGPPVYYLRRIRPPTGAEQFGSHQLVSEQFVPTTAALLLSISATIFSVAIINTINQFHFNLADKVVFKRGGML